MNWATLKFAICDLKSLYAPKNKPKEHVTSLFLPISDTHLKAKNTSGLPKLSQ